MATKIITKNSSTATSIPTAGDLVQGELAVNVTDKRLFTEDSGGAIVELGTNPSTLTSGAATFSGTVTADDAGFYQLAGTSQLRVGASSSYNWNISRDNVSTGGLQIQSKDAAADVTRAFFALNGDISFYEDTGTTPKFFWDASAESLGIGTNTPSAPLDIKLAGTSTADIFKFQRSDGAVAGVLNYNGTDGAISLGTTTSHPLAFDTNNVERMRIDGASGNVGIGRTSNIDYLLDVQKPADAYIRISSATTQENAGIILANQNGTKWIIEKDGPSHDLFIKSAAVTAMTISQAGNLGLGTTTPAYQLTLSSNPSFWEAGLQTEVVGGNQVLKIVSDAFGGGGRTGNIEFHVNSVGATPAVKINASGNLLVGSSSPPANRRLYVESVNYPAQMYATTAGINYPTLQLKNAHATGGNTCTQIDFRNAADASVGQVKSTASATIFATSSDYRLKEDDVAMTGATERVKALRPINFAWKLDGSRVDGFFAHELAEVVPEAATGTKDAMCDEEYEVTPAVEEVRDEDGNVTTEAVAAVMGTRSVPDYQGIDQSKLVPLLTAALQEAIAKIETLEARLEALEGA